MVANYNKSLFKDYDELISKIEKASILIKEQANIIKMLKTEINIMDNLLVKKDEQIDILILEIERLKNNNNKDSSNSGKPSSKNGFKKIKNNRENTDKNQGGQKGHKGNTLKASTVKSLIDSGNVKHTVIEVNKTHENQSKDYKIRYVQDIEIKTIITEYHYYPNNKGMYNIPKKQSNIVTYGSDIKAVSMLLVHRVPASMDRP